MDANFWIKKWETNDIGFHGGEVNPLLVKWIKHLSLPESGRIFLPLCGKTRDIAWLLSRGYRVVGAELSGLAVEQLFAELDCKPVVMEMGRVKRLSADRIDIFLGDFFDVHAAVLGPVDAVYDRAALVALPEQMRRRYTQHLCAIAPCAEQLVISYVYDQSQIPGPPFAVCDEELKGHYEATYAIQLLETVPLTGGLKNKCPAEEKVWRLKRLHP